MKALVLRKTAFGESDLVVRALLESGDVLSFFATGARRSQKRFPHRFDMNGVYDFDWREAGGGDRLRSLSRADLIDHAPELTQNIERWARWLLILEWLSHQDSQELSFEGLLQLRREMADSASPGLSFHRFLLEQMKWHGLMPELNECVACHGVIEGPRHFILALSGMAHPLCHKGEEVSDETLAYIKSEGHKAPPIVRIESVIDELDRISFPYLSQQLGRSLRAQSFFEQLKSQNLSCGSHLSSPPSL